VKEAAKGVKEAAKGAVMPQKQNGTRASVTVRGVDLTGGRSTARVAEAIGERLSAREKEAMRAMKSARVVMAARERYRRILGPCDNTCADVFKRLEEALE